MNQKCFCECYSFEKHRVIKLFYHYIYSFAVNQISIFRHSHFFINILDNIHSSLSVITNYITSVLQLLLLLLNIDIWYRYKYFHQFATSRITYPCYFCTRILRTPMAYGCFSRYCNFEIFESVKTIQEYRFQRPKNEIIIFLWWSIQTSFSNY